jgi:membrane protease YdiL (CAAX protease family)
VKSSDERSEFRLTDVVVGYIGATVLANICMGMATSAGADAATIFLSTLAGLWAGLLVMLVFVARRRVEGHFFHHFHLVVKSRDLLPSFLLGVTCQLLAVPFIYGLLGIFFDVRSWGNVADELLDNYGRGWNIVPLAISLVIVAPVVEELFYRGLLLRALLLRMPERAAIVVAAAVFGVVHFEWLQFFGLFFFGLVACLLAVRTKRLGPGIIAHVGFNAASLAIVLLA